MCGIVDEPDQSEQTTATDNYRAAIFDEDYLADVSVFNLDIILKFGVENAARFGTTLIVAVAGVGIMVSAEVSVMRMPWG